MLALKDDRAESGDVTVVGGHRIGPKLHDQVDGPVIGVDVDDCKLHAFFAQERLQLELLCIESEEGRCVLLGVRRHAVSFQGLGNGLVQDTR